MLFERKNKQAAIELSMTTIIILVLGVAMLVLGIVLIRSVMCGGVSLTQSINGNVKGQIAQLFNSNQGEVTCIGYGDPVKMVVGKQNFVFCAIRAPVEANYKITLKSYSAINTKQADLQKWIRDTSWSGRVPPGDELPKKAVSLLLPANAPEDNIRMQVEITKDGTLLSTQDLSFEITRLGFFQASMC